MNKQTFKDAESCKSSYQRRLSRTVRDESKAPGRNEPCPCGKGLKFKKCHGRGQ
jgi:uncharacterized protein YecA (UPF0149 family)